MNNYWEDRFKQLEKASNSYGQKIYREIEGIFKDSEIKIQKEIESWYERFAQNNDMTMVEAKKLLNTRELDEFKWDVDKYIKIGKENALNQKWMKELENASSRFHVNRLEALDIRLQQISELAFQNQLDHVDDMANKIFKNNYYHTMFEVQKGFNVGFDVSEISDRRVRNIISKPWAGDGENFSSRIWKNKNKLINEIHKELTQTILLGESSKRAIKNISKKMNINKINASRLVMTELAFFHTISQREAFKELDAEKYEILAVLDSKTSLICQDFDGQIFDLKDMKIGVNAPPFHPNCRSVILPYYKDYGSGERAVSGENKSIYYIPSDMKYKDWKKFYVDGEKDRSVELIDFKIEKLPKREKIKELNKLRDSGLSKDDYNEYMEIINNHPNDCILNIYSKYADEIEKVKLISDNGKYYTSDNKLEFSIGRHLKYKGINKYEILAHEYAHFFDYKVSFSNINFREIEALRDSVGFSSLFKPIASSSDEFLEAIRKDKKYLRSLYNSKVKAELAVNHASCGVQDAIDGLFTKSRINFGHGERYYNRIYAILDSSDKMLRSTKYKKALQQVYKDLGFDASNQSKVKMICRQYYAASEAWANIMSAEVCGGESLEYVKKYLPNSYKAFIDILKGMN